MSDRISVRVTIPRDEDGFIGRECPESECLGYFKIEPGTGLSGEDLPCHCPYCGYSGPHDTFWTQDQLKYIQSAGMREVQKQFHDMLAEAFRPTRGRQKGLVSLSFKVTPGAKFPLHRYREEQLETDLVCAECGLHYAVYGVFAFCPDCRVHNSLQMLVANLSLATKELELAASQEEPLRGQLVSDALENAVAAFDGFGREVFRVGASRASDPRGAANLRCQNLPALRTRVISLFRIDLAESLEEHEWTELIRAFQKRHLVAHKMGVVDAEYIAATGDTEAVVGRKVSIVAEEVGRSIPLIRRLAEHVWTKVDRAEKDAGVSDAN